MRKFTTFLTTAVIVACSLMPCMGATAKYNLTYADGRPSQYDVLVQEFKLKSSGKDCVVIKSTKFTSYISGASADAYTKSDVGQSKTHVINRTGSTYYIDYPGTTQPKANTNVYVHIELTDYAPAKSVTAQGTITT